MALTKATNRMTNGAMVNVFDFGAVGDGSTDDTTAIQAAIDSLSSTGGVVYMPAGTYKVTTGITLADNNVKVKGEGWKATNIVLYADVAGFTITGAYCELTGFHLSKSGSHTKNGITVGSSTPNYGDRFRIREVFIDGMGNHGVEVIASALMYIEDVTSINNGGDGLHIDDTYVMNVNINSGGVIDVRGNVNGINIKGGGTFDSSSHNFGTIISQSNSGHGIKLACRSSNFNAVYTENNTGDGLHLTADANGNKCHIINGGITDNGSGNAIFHEDIESEKAGMQFLELSGTSTGGWKINSGAGTYNGNLTFRHSDNSEFTYTAAGHTSDFTVKHANSASGKIINVETDGAFKAGTYLEVTDGVTAPGTGSGARIYVDTADGDLKVKFSDGTVKTISVDT